MASKWIFACLLAELCLCQVVRATVWVSMPSVLSEYGSTARFSCHYSVSSPNEYTLNNLVWSKGTGQSKRRIAYIPGGSLTPTYMYGYDRPRFTMTTTGSVSNLIISKVRHEDAGSYSCKVEYLTSTFGEEIGVASGLLTVYVPPKPNDMKIVYGGKAYKDGDSIPVVAGNSRQFTCTATGITPAATFVWSLNDGGTNLPVGTPAQTDTPTTPPLMNSTSIITVANTGELATVTLGCRAYNTPNGSAGANIAVTLQISERNPGEGEASDTASSGGRLPSTPDSEASEKPCGDEYAEYLRWGVRLAKAEIRKMEVEEEKLREETKKLQLEQQKLQLEVAILTAKAPPVNNSEE